MNRVAAQRIVGTLGIAVFAVLLLTATLAVAGYDATAALHALWRGSFGTWYAFASGTLIRATPLIIAGLATTVAFRTGVMNIGVEGQLLAGAACAAALALCAPGLGVLLVPLGLAAGIAGGMLWASGPAWLKARFGVVEVISTLMLNAIALQMIAWLVRGPLQEPTHVYPQSALISEAARLPLVVPSARLHAGFAIAIVLAGLAWWVFARTATGFRLRAVGANAHAARIAGGVDVRAVTTGAFLVSGALAGLAGAVELQGVTFALYESLAPGYGYTAIAVALLARLDVRAVLPSAVFFAALEAGASTMQRDAGVPAALVKVVEALLILTVLISDAWQRRQRAAAQVS